VITAINTAKISENGLLCHVIFAVRPINSASESITRPGIIREAETPITGKDWLGSAKPVSFQAVFFLAQRAAIRFQAHRVLGGYGFSPSQPEFAPRTEAKKPACWAEFAQEAGGRRQRQRSKRFKEDFRYL
jgi:hypothetical protein